MFVPSVDVNAAPSPRCFSRTGGEDFCPLRANDHDACRVHRASGEFAFEGLWGVAAYVRSSNYGELIKRVQAVSSHSPLDPSAAAPTRR